jgi:hypothetical protein
MDQADLGELDAAIKAHCDFLEAAGVQLAMHPGDVLASHLLTVVLDRGGIVGAVVTSLISLCALRTRATARAARMKEAARATTSGAKRRAAAITDDRHLERLRPSLKQLGERLRTAVRSLARFEGELRARHQRLAKLRVGQGSGASVDAALTRWVMARCQVLAKDLEFFAVEMEGPIAMPPIGYAGPAEGKAWHRVRADSLLILEGAGMTGRERRSLFPVSFQRKGDAADERRAVDRERKARKQAKMRKKSEG